MIVNSPRIIENSAKFVLPLPFAHSCKCPLRSPRLLPPLSPPPPPPSTTWQSCQHPFGGVILVVVTFLCGGIFFFFFKKKKKEEKGEEGAEAPAKTEEIPLDDLTPDVPSPQAALTADWLRARQAGDNSRPLRVLVEPRGPNVAQPAADSLAVDEGVKFVPVPPGYGVPASGRPASRARPSPPLPPRHPDHPRPPARRLARLRGRQPPAH
ncbi:hypothetical protein N7519_003941 [Penicillium mononematosum]|uniref:uncharacterized protein n=1 Tax=Penicillium mononematosum TaxID=268346 RepID=UPI0025466F6D|nr:uncharacterized protein N7519_003941 [Penicillium mononematosum]KAJ6189033.1 hypothetical protein N7519_003941 [Penicillium mononematosum]